MPWLRRQTSLRIGVSESFVCLSYESHFLWKTQNFSQNLSARDWILIDEGIWLESKEEIKTKNRGDCLGFFVLAPLKTIEDFLLWTWTKDPLISRLRHKFYLPVIRQSFAYANRKSLQSDSQARLNVTWWGSLVKIKERGKMKTESYWTPFSFCGSPFWTWTKDPLIIATNLAARRCVGKFCLSLLREPFSAKNTKL